MAQEPHGELVPVGGGETIGLTRERLTMGRRESCDICLHFPNVSSVHCELSFHDGYWYLQDKNSTNGVKVNGLRIFKKMLVPGDEITIAKRKYHIKYTLPSDRRMEELLEMEDQDVMNQSLLERAGLEKGRGYRDEDTDEFETTPRPPTRRPRA
jgi:adenylate cyclase